MKRPDRAMLRSSGPAPSIHGTTDMQRREFLQASATLSMLSGIQSTASAAKAVLPSADLPIIDTHQHLWDLRMFKPPWLANAAPVLASNHVTKDYLAAVKGLNVVKAIYMEVDVHPRDHVREARHVIELAKSKQHPTAAAVISGRPNQEGFAGYLTPLLESGYVKGVRQVLHVPSAKQGLCLERQFVASMRFLGEKGLTYDLCMRPTELDDGAKLAGLCKETTFIVDHCGNADPSAFLAGESGAATPAHKAEPWKRSIAKLAGLQNVVCKISGVIARVPKPVWKPDHLAPIINFCLDEFGPDRVVFGGDWPVCKLGGSFKQWVNALKQVIAERPAAEQKKLLHVRAINSLS